MILTPEPANDKLFTKKQREKLYYWFRAVGRGGRDLDRIRVLGGTIPGSLYDYLHGRDGGPHDTDA